MNLLTFFGVLGCVAGLTGGLAGTYLAVQSARGPRERSLMRRGAVWCWIGVVGYFVAMGLVPTMRPAICAVAALMLPVGLRVWNRRQVAMRQWEVGQAQALTAAGNRERPEGGRSAE